MNCLRTGRLLMVISAKGLTISFMEKRAPGGRPKNRSADYSGNCSTFDQKQLRAPSSTKLVPEVFSRHRLGAYFCSKNRRSPREPCAAGFLPSFGPWHTNCSLVRDRKSTRLNSSHVKISYAVFCLKKKISLRAEVSYD